MKSECICDWKSTRQTIDRPYQSCLLYVTCLCPVSVRSLKHSFSLSKKVLFALVSYEYADASNHTVFYMYPVTLLSTCSNWLSHAFSTLLPLNPSHPHNHIFSVLPVLAFIPHLSWAYIHLSRFYFTYCLLSIQIRASSINIIVFV